MASAHEVVRPPPLARNCVTAISVDGLAKDHDGQVVTLDLTRGSPGELRQRHHGDVPDGYVGVYLVPEMPKANRYPPLRPDQPSVQLQLQLGDMIAYNERHAVYDVTVAKAEPDDFFIPPLVLKVAQTDEAGRLLSKEAGMYEHIRRLQGSVAPRFYGYFHAANEQSEWTRVNPAGSESTSKLPDDVEYPFPGTPLPPAMRST